MTSATAPTHVKSAMRTLDVIEYVVAHGGGVVAQDIARELTIPDSSLSYLLATLVERDYLARDGRRYRAGPGLDRLRAPAHALSLEDRAVPLVRSLRREFNETCSFMIRTEWEAEALVTESSDRELRYTIAAGHRRPLHCLAAGKAILAALPEDEVARYFAQSVRQKFTATTLTQEKALRRELGKIREAGYAEAFEESTPGICSIGRAAVRGDTVLGSFAFAIPVVRYDASVRDRADMLLAKAASALSGPEGARDVFS